MSSDAPSSSSPGRVSELMKQVRLLEIAARKNAVNWMSGDYITSIRGGGMVFHEARKYVVGESARLIDWNITARLGEPYVKVHQEERQRNIMLLVDVSPSMHLGFQRKTKLEFAIELAATLAVSGIEGGDRVGHILFADRVLAEARPEQGPKQLFRILAELLDWTEPWQRPVEETDPRVAIHALAAHRRGRFVVFLISDFIDHDVPDDLRYMGAQHDVTLLHVYDPFEFAASPLVFTGFSPEGDSGTVTMAPGARAPVSETHEFLAAEAARYRIGVESFSTNEPIPIVLDRIFHRKRRQLVR